MGSAYEIVEIVYESLIGYLFAGDCEIRCCSPIELSKFPDLFTGQRFQAEPGDSGGEFFEPLPFSQSGLYEGFQHESENTRIGVWVEGIGGSGVKVPVQSSEFRVPSSEFRVRTFTTI